MATFIQSTFNEISLERDQALWMSADDSRLEDRLRLLSEFPQCHFRHQLSESAPAVRLCRKNPKLSGALREKGNLSYAQGDPDAALQFYNQTLQFADADEETALVFGNRSAVWADKREWGLAVRDIDLALASGYPPDLRYKLLERKAHCLFSRGGEQSRTLAKECVTEALEALKRSKLRSAKLKAKEEQISKMGPSTGMVKKVALGCLIPLTSCLRVLATPGPTF